MNLQLKNICLAIIFLFNSIAYADKVQNQQNIDNFKSLSIPLKYRPDFGVYTAYLQVQNHERLIDVIIDTGSPLTVILGNKSLCPKCTPFITKSLIPDDLLFSYQPSQSQITYGTSQDETVEANLNVNFHKYTTPIRFKSHIITKGYNTSNIMGISPVAEDWKKYSYISNLLEDFKLKKEFTFLLCGTNNNSLVFGEYLPKNHKEKPLTNVKRTELILDNYYTINVAGIEDEKGNPLVKYYPNNYSKAILDSGTGGLIVLPNSIYDFVIKYIREEYREKNSSIPLSENFWRKNYCVKNSVINNKDFPKIKLTFPDFHNQYNSISITLTPKHYINEGGCGKGYRRLSFAHHENYQELSKHKKTPKETEPSYFILGTPVFEQYGISFNLDEKPRVKFFNKNIPCQDK